MALLVIIVSVIALMIAANIAQAKARRGRIYRKYGHTETMSTREDMNAALKELVVPVLRERGFSGSFPHFRRIKEEVDLLTFQFDRNGGGFVIETAKGKKEGFTTHWGKHIPAAKLTAWDLHPNDRKRLKPGPDGSTESWFRYDASDSCESVARSTQLDPQRSAQPVVRTNALRAWLILNVSQKMGLPIYSLSAEKFEALESSLRASGFGVEKRNAPGKLSSLRTRDGFASAVIFELTEKKDSEPHVGVGGGRGGLFSSLFLWPFDRKHVRAVQEHLVRVGARPVVFSPNEKG